MKAAMPHTIRTSDMRARDMMSCNPLSIRDEATVAEAIAFLTDKGFRAAPVIDASGRPVGVISQSDILVHGREGPNAHEYFSAEDLRHLGRPASAPGLARVRDLMTPAVFQVRPDAHFARVLEEMVALKVHRLFVVAEDGVLVGVITALDLLRHMYHEIRKESAEWLTA